MSANHLKSNSFKSQWVNYFWSLLPLPNICLWKCWISPKYWVWYAVYLEIIAFLQIISANTHKNSIFCIPNYVLSKCATPMNKHLKSTMSTSKSYAAFAMQKSFKDQSTPPDMARCQFFEHFTLKVLCMAKYTQAFGANQQHSK